jgi:rhamnosyltransferase
MTSVRSWWRWGAALGTHSGIAVITPARDNVCAVVVTFHPDRELPARVERIASQVRRVVIVDNHSDEPAVAMLRALASRLGVRLILNAENLGVATALNQGMSEAARQGFAWALLFDQDTVPFESMVATLGRAFDEYPDKGRLAVIGSNYLEASTGRASFALESDGGASWAERAVAITSGSLVSVPAFEAVGRFRDEFFIDQVDFDYCLRARAKGFSVIMTRAPLMTHSIGAAEVRRFLWRTAIPSNHSPVRWYYMTRNSLVLAREHWRREPGWVRTNLYTHLKWMAKVVLYEEGKWSKVSHSLRGAWHAARGRLGRL